MGVDQVSPRRVMAGLLILSTDSRPKVRKRAQEAVKRILASRPSSSPSLDHPAADMCGETAMKSLRENATRALDAQRQNTSNDPKGAGLIHALQLVRTVASSTGGWPSSKIEPLCELLLEIAKAGNQYMMVVVFEIFEMIFQGTARDGCNAKLPRLVEIIGELRPSTSDTQLLPPWIAILSRAYDVSSQLEPEETFLKLPEVFEMVTHFMESPAENIRVSASECLISFLSNCLPEQVILEPSTYDEGTLGKLVKVAEGLLALDYQAGWAESFRLFGVMFDKLRWTSYPLMVNILRHVGEIRGNEAFSGKRQADHVIGRAIRAMGPEAVLELMPLNLSRPSKNQPGRAWMLPLLRDYVSNTKLEHFKATFIPLAVALDRRFQENGDMKSMETKIYETLYQQVWSLLPGYCDLPLDLLPAFDQAFAEQLAKVLYERPTLRLDVCRALKKLIDSNKTIATIDGEENLLLQSRIPIAQAQKHLDHLSIYAGNMLAVLFNVYTQTLPQSRGPILETINSFISITPKSELIETFQRVCQMLSSSLPGSITDKKQGQPDQMPSTAQTLMDIVITISVHLPRTLYSSLFNIAATAIKQSSDPQLQKKAYKLIPRLAGSEIGKEALKERFPEIQALILGSASMVAASARRDRLAAISALIPFTPEESLHFIPSVLSEAVLGCKEHKEKARVTAFDLVVQLGARMNQSNGAIIQNNKVRGLSADTPPVKASIDEYFTMLSAGLAGGTPHMISATITVVSRVLYEFWASTSVQTMLDMVQTIELFLTSKSMEIVKSCLGFFKVCIITLPVELMQPRLNTLIPNLLMWSHEHKGHFKAKVKHMLERMMRRFGVDVVNRNTPEEDRKLVSNIRKARERAKRRKGAGNNISDELDSEEEQDNPQHDNAYDEALCSSSDSGREVDDGDVQFRKDNSKRKRGLKTYIIEDDEEPLDLLDRKALAHFSSTKPIMVKQKQKTKAKIDLDGKLILGEETQTNEGGAMDVDEVAPVEESGVGAYVAALKSGNLVRRGKVGKVKFSNRHARDEELGNGMDVDEGDIKTIRNAVSGGNRGEQGRSGFKAGRGVFSWGRGAAGAGRGKNRNVSNGRRGLGEDKRRGTQGGGKVMKSPKHTRKR